MCLTISTSASLCPVSGRRFLMSQCQDPANRGSSNQSGSPRTVSTTCHFPSKILRPDLVHLRSQPHHLVRPLEVAPLHLCQGIPLRVWVADCGLATEAELTRDRPGTFLSVIVWDNFLEILQHSDFEVPSRAPARGVQGIVIRLEHTLLPRTHSPGWHWTSRGHREGSEVSSFLSFSLQLLNVLQHADLTRYRKVIGKASVLLLVEGAVPQHDPSIPISCAHCSWLSEPVKLHFIHFLAINANEVDDLQGRTCSKVEEQLLSRRSRTQGTNRPP